MNQIILGDCLEKMKNIPDKSVDMILTDLPYGVTNNDFDIKLNLDLLWDGFNRVKKQSCVIVLTAIQPFSTFLINSNPKYFKYEWIWQKVRGYNFLLAYKQPLRNHEQILVFYEKQPTYNPQMTFAKKENIRNPHNHTTNPKCNTYNVIRKDSQKVNPDVRFPVTVLFFPELRSSNRFHPSEKPIALFEYLIKTYSNKGDTILDCCAGSGTTAIACINTNRNYICIEKEESYFKIMQDRINQISQPLEAFNQ